MLPLPDRATLGSLVGRQVTGDTVVVGRSSNRMFRVGRDEQQSILVVLGAQHPDADDVEHGRPVHVTGVLRAAATLPASEGGLGPEDRARLDALGVYVEAERFDGS